ncbi:MAG: NAD(P)H-hydrate dehydratase [Chitinophagales bacterium]|nr:NAD(P)H-hydrate dehydratase [Chitinophagales bacterium]
MIPILSSLQIAEADRYTIEHEPIAPIDLMERAAEAFIKCFTQKFKVSSPVYIFCGKGNNGGDGLAIGRLLQNYNYEIYVFILNQTGDSSEAFLINESRIKNTGLLLTYIKSEKKFPELHKEAIIVDALFGTGLNKPLKGLAEELVKYLNVQQATRVSVDIPSGLYADKPTRDLTFKAHHTITFQYPKLSFLFCENLEAIGEWYAVDIGLAKIIWPSNGVSHFFLERMDIERMLKPRKKFDHKGSFGHAFIHAGSKGKMGAAIMCTLACVRTGAGLITVHIPEGYTAVFNITVPEAMTEEYLGDESLNSKDLSKYNAFAFGPGIGTTANAKKKFLGLLSAVRAAAVFDADALNIISQEENDLTLLPADSIITPHPKEFERLAGVSSDWADRLQRQMDLSKKHHLYIILKGAYTCISTPQGKCYFNSTGNPGMAKGGSGDVLTGMVASFLAQGYHQEEASLLSVYLHGLSADIAVKKQSEQSLLATDIISTIGDAFREISAPAT